jgi:hypothetical protein
LLNQGRLVEAVPADAEGAELAVAPQVEDALEIGACRLTPSAKVGVPAEEYDPSDRRQFGSFPQAFSHLALINTARNLGNTTGPAELRSRRGDATTPAAAEATSRR